MKKILYLHGLESKVGGVKETYLRENNKVLAPSLDYSKPLDLSGLVSDTYQFNPDLIIGSSFGGYYAEMVARFTKTEVLLLNPQIMPDLFKLPSHIHVKARRYGHKRTIILGMKDDIVPPKVTKDYYKDKAKFIELKNVGHRIPLKEFVDIYNKHF